MQNYIKCLAIRIPIEIEQYPEPTFSRYLTKRNYKTGKVYVYTRECIYWLDSNVYTPKQLVWFADIKTKIQKRLPEVTFVECEPEARYITDTGATFSLKSLQSAWKRKITPKKESILQKVSKSIEIVKDDDAIVDEELIDLPSLVPLLSGKYEQQLYTALCRYASKLYYEKKLQFEYLYRAAKIYNKHSEEKVLEKKLLKLTHKAFNYISEEIKNNPENFKQKLEPKQLRNARVRNALKLQARNKQTRKDNTAKVKEAIESGRHYKSDAVTLNVSSLAVATKLSRMTVKRTLDKLNT